LRGALESASWVRAAINPDRIPKPPMNDSDPPTTRHVLSFYLQAARMLNLRRGTHRPEEIDADVRSGVQVAGVNLWVLVFAILVASVGLNVNSTAVIIGAMLISPLMGPIVGVGYGLAIEDFALIRLSLRNLLIFTAISLGTSTLYFALSPLVEPGSELLARTAPTLWDVLIAFFGGSAGAIAMTRRNVPIVVPGVAIATALMPPVCTAGFALAHQRWAWLGGALYLFTINSVFIAFATLLFIKVMRLRSLTRPVDEDAARRARWLTTITVVAVAAPSIVLAYRLVQAESFAAAARRSVAEISKDPRFVVIDSQIDGTARRVTLTVGGEDPPADLPQQIEAVLRGNGYPGSKVLVRSASSRQLDVGDLKREVQSSVVQQLAKEAEGMQAQVRALQSKIDTQRSKEEAATHAEDATLRLLPKEIQALYPQIGDVTVGLASADAGADPTASVPRKVMIQVKLIRALGKTDRARLLGWLRVRLPGSDVRLAYLR
jgi:uncharacterized hydrophobic protein (TIGR00271 family)